MAEVETNLDGAVLTIMLNRPDVLNAFNTSMHAALRAALEEAEDASVRAVVLMGAGRGFCVGQDLSEFKDSAGDIGDRLRSNYHPNVLAIRALEKPVIAAVNGPAYAAGFILSLNCDIRIAGDNARFCAVGARIGLVPVGGQLSRLLDVVGYPAAFKMLATAAPVGAAEALASGFVSEVCDPDQTLERAIALAQEISEVSPAVVRAIKTGLRTTLFNGLAAGMAVEPQLAAIVRDLPDGDEGVRSFLEKRPPRYPDAPTDLQDKLDKAGTHR